MFQKNTATSGQFVQTYYLYKTVANKTEPAIAFSTIVVEATMTIPAVAAIPASKCPVSKDESVPVVWFTGIGVIRCVTAPSAVSVAESRNLILLKFINLLWGLNTDCQN